MKYRPKILHLISKINYSQGGPPRMVLGVMTAQNILKYKSKILSTSSEKIKKKNVITGRLIGDRYAIPSIELIFQFFKHIKKFDIIHFHNFWNVFISISILVAKIYKKKIILSPHGSLHKENIKKNFLLKFFFYKLIAKRILGYVNKFHFLNMNEKKNFAFKNFIKQKNNFVVPNSIKIIKLKNLRLKKFNKSKFNFTYIGRISKNKGLELLINGYLDFKKKNDNISLSIIGPSSKYKKYLIKKFNFKLGMNNIYFHKPIFNDIRFNIMNKSNGVFLLSDLECDSILSKEVWSSKGLLVTTKNAFNESFYKKEIALIIPKNKRAVSNILDKITKKRKSMDKIRENGYRYSLNKLNILKNTKKLTISY